jgi:hypothetical protein
MLRPYIYISTFARDLLVISYQLMTNELGSGSRSETALLMTNDQ